MSADNKRRRIVTNAILSSSNWSLPLVLSFLTTPILIGFFGHDRYGLYLLILGFINHSFTFGIGKAAAKYVAEYGVTGDDELVSEAVSFSLWLSITLGVSGATLTLILAQWFLDETLRIPAELSSEGRAGLMISAFIILASMVSQLWSFVLQGLHRFDRYAVISAFGSGLGYAGLIGLASRGGGIAAVLLWNLAVTCLLAAFYFRAVKRASSGTRIRTKIRSTVRSAVLRYSGAIILTQIFGNALLLIERLWIARDLGVDALTYYVVPMTLALFVHAFVGSIVIVLFPVFNEQLEAADRMTRLYRGSTKFVLAIASFAILTSLILGRSILFAWVGEEIAEKAAWILPIQMITFGMLAVSTVAWQVVESVGKARANVIFSVSCLIVGGGLIVLLGGRYGLEGVAAARLIGGLGVIPLMIFVEHRVLRSFSVKYWAASILRLAVAVAVAGTVQWLVQDLLHGRAAALYGTTAGGIAFALSLLAARYFEADELNWFRRSLSPSKS